MQRARNARINEIFALAVDAQETKEPDLVRRDAGCKVKGNQRMQ